MIGRRTGETYRLGDHVTVKLVEAIPVAGALRFELLSSGRLERRAGKVWHPAKTGRDHRRDDRRPRKRRG